MKRLVGACSVAAFSMACGGRAVEPARATPTSAVAPSKVSAPPAAADAMSCWPPQADERSIDLDGAALPILCRGVYGDPKSTPVERKLIAAWYGEALRGLASFFGAVKSEPPAVIVCTSDPCALHFSGPTRRSRAFMEPYPKVVINGVDELTKGTMVHEMVHIEMIRRMGERRSQAPAWFHEGVASFIGDNTPCPPGYKHGIDDLRRLRAYHAWDYFTEVAGKMDATYCQAHDEVAAWAERHGRSALLGVIDAVAAGRSFEEAYGPFVTATSTGDRDLDANFALDENSESHGVDSTGRSHLASLLGGAAWTSGHRGAGVKVVGGAYVRAEGFLEYGLPDKPFSLSLWVKPLTNAHVLVHTAVNPSGGQGWCLPLLGHDGSGHLVAQVPFGLDPKAFLSATGPVLPLNKWSHVAVTWDEASGVRLFVNGTASGARAPQSGAEHHREAPAASMYLLFGSDNGAKCWTRDIEPGHWNGSLDDIHVYNYALSPEQVLADMRK